MDKRIEYPQEFRIPDRPGAGIHIIDCGIDIPEWIGKKIAGERISCFKNDQLCKNGRYGDQQVPTIGLYGCCKIITGYHNEIYFHPDWFGKGKLVMVDFRKNPDKLIFPRYDRSAALSKSAGVTFDSICVTFNRPVIFPPGIGRDLAFVFKCFVKAAYLFISALHGNVFHGFFRLS